MNKVLTLGQSELALGMPSSLKGRHGLLLAFSLATVVKMIATARALQVRSRSQKSTISRHRAYATYAIVILINAHALYLIIRFPRNEYLPLPSTLARGIESRIVARIGSKCCMYMYVFPFCFWNTYVTSCTLVKVTKISVIPRSCSTIFEVFWLHLSSCCEGAHSFCFLNT